MKLNIKPLCKFESKIAFYYTFSQFINDKKLEGPCAKVWEPFWIIRCYFSKRGYSKTTGA